MTGKWIRQAGECALGRFGARLAALPVAPSAYSVGSALFAVVAGVLLAANHSRAAVGAIVLAGIGDFLDGFVTRRRILAGRPVLSGGTLLHVLSDKIGDTAIFLGMGVGHHAAWTWVLLAIAIGWALTVFGRMAHRFGGLNLERSLFDRADRLICLIVFGLFQRWTWCLVFVVLMDLVCLLHRVWLVRTGPGHRGSRA